MTSICAVRVTQRPMLGEQDLPFQSHTEALRLDITDVSRCAMKNKLLQRGSHAIGGTARQVPLELAPMASARTLNKSQQPGASLAFISQQVRAQQTHESAQERCQAHRSTSPPKSAWPGVSTALTTCPLYRMDVYLAEMVIPRSFSSTLLSM